MKELSIFIDESGDFGEYDYHSPYYIIAMVFHDQSADIEQPMKKLEQDLTLQTFPGGGSSLLDGACKAEDERRIALSI